MLFGAAVVLLAACGSGSAASTAMDWAPSFTGTWNGTISTTVAGGLTTTVAGYVVITETGTNALLIGHACPDGLNTSGPPATVVSASAFTVGPYSCPAVAQGGCPSFVLNFTGGNGLMCRNGEPCLPSGIFYQGTTAGCGTTAQITQKFYPN
jgi:hypothetical protein